MIALEQSLYLPSSFDPTYEVEVPADVTNGMDFANLLLNHMDDLLPPSEDPVNTQLNKKTLRRLRHNEAMVRFRRRKKARIAGLEQQVLQLEDVLHAKLSDYRVTRASPSSDTDAKDDELRQRHYAYIDAVMQREELLRENNALELRIEEYEKFHVVTDRVHTRHRETNLVWRCTGDTSTISNEKIN